MNQQAPEFVALRAKISRNAQAYMEAVRQREVNNPGMETRLKDVDARRREGDEIGARRLELNIYRDACHIVVDQMW